MHFGDFETKDPPQGEIRKRNLWTHKDPQNLPELIFIQNFEFWWGHVRINSIFVLEKVNWTDTGQMRAANRSTIVQLSFNYRSLLFTELKQVKWEQAIVQLSFNYRSAIVQLSFTYRSTIVHRSFNDRALNWNKSNESRQLCNFRANYRSGTRGTFLILGCILGTLFSFAIFVFLWFYNHKRGRTTRNSGNEPGIPETLWKHRCHAIFWLNNFVRPSSVGSPQTLVPRKVWGFVHHNSMSRRVLQPAIVHLFFFLGGGGVSGTLLFQVALQTYTMWVCSSWSLCKTFVCPGRSLLPPTPKSIGLPSPCGLRVGVWTLILRLIRAAKTAQS